MLAGLGRHHYRQSGGDYIPVVVDTDIDSEGVGVGRGRGRGRS